MRNFFIFVIFLIAIAIFSQNKILKRIFIKEINSPYSDLAPAISGDGKFMVFESNRDDEYNYDLYATINLGGKWVKPKPLKSINSPDFDGLPCISPDGNLIIFSSNRKGFVGKEPNMDLWISYRKGVDFSKPKNLGPVVNSFFYDGTPSISYNRKILFFSSNRPGGKGGFDIWYTEYKNGKWKRPVNLEVVNSPYDDTAPSIQPDMKILFFSSNRPGGYGGFDIYEVRFDNGKWSKVKNLGDWINTSKDELYFSMPATFDVIYTSSG